MKRAGLVMSGLILVASILSAQEKITVKGSDTMVILAQRWAERYMMEQKDISIQVTGGGSGTGIAALINGTADICNSSRPMKLAERDKLYERYGSRGIEIKCAQDGLSLYVNETSPISELSMQQIKGIYTGKVTSWKDVGGPEQRIVVYGRESNSGTYVYFREHVLEGEDFAATVQRMAGTAAVVNEVSKNTWAIGYGGAAYGKGIRELKVKANAKSIAYAPTLQNIKSGVYPVSRFLFMYLRSTPTGMLKKYIDWILGDEGQKIVGEVGYFPIR